MFLYIARLPPVFQQEPSIGDQSFKNILDLLAGVDQVNDLGRKGSTQCLAVVYLSDSCRLIMLDMHYPNIHGLALTLQFEGASFQVAGFNT
jgi:hypothetical protein